MAEGTFTRHPRARSFIIKRPRLTKLLDESEARILLLLAPAGYGKTTLAREWLEGKEGVAWYSGGPAMGDVAALAAGIAEALSPLAIHEVNDLSELIRLLASRGQPANALAQAIAKSELAKRCQVLAIDDCHIAATSTEATEFFKGLLSVTEFKVVATSRIRLPWVTPRMLVYGEAIALEKSDLAFTTAETAEILGASAELEGILSDADGWPAVIGLAAMRQSTGAPTRGVNSADLYEFIAEDLFEAASPPLKAALLVLALSADAPLEVTLELLGADHDAILAQASEHGFLAGISATATLHPLLRRFLFTKVRGLPNDEVESLVRRVAGRLIAHDCWDAALALFEEFPIVDLIAPTIDCSLVDLLAAGRVATIKRWLTLASASAITDPIFLLAEAEVALRERDERRAQVLGERAGELFGTGDAAARALIVAGRAAHLRDDCTAAQAYCAKAELLATSIETEVESLWIQFISAAEEHSADAAVVFERMRKVRDERPEHTLRVHNAKAFMLFLVDGQPRAAAVELDLATGLLPHVRDPVLRTNYLNLYSHVMLVLGDYEHALEIARRQIAEAEASGLEFAVDHALLAQVGAQIGLRSFLAAQRSIAQLEARSSTASDYILRNTNLMAARIRIATGDLRRAELLLRHRTGAGQAEWSEQVAYHGLVLAALGKISDAESRFSDAQSGTPAIDTTAIAEIGQAVAALVRGGEGEERFARSALERALGKGCVDATVTACRAFPQLARVGAQDSRLGARLTEVFARSRDTDLGRRAGLEMPRELRRTDVLSPRELEVYELLVQGRTNGEIAETLFISESTAKVHVRHIFEKLGVHTRAEAARATLKTPSS